MSIKTISRIQIGQIAILIFTLLFILGLLFVNYSAAMALLIGIILAWFIRLVVRFANRISVLLYVGILLLIALAVISSLALLGPQIANIFSRVTSGLTGGGSIFEHYQVVIEPMNPALETFLIREEVEYTINGEKNRLRLPQRHLSGTSRGLFVKELKINALDMDSSGTVIWTLPDGTVRRDALCPMSCPIGSVELKDWPKNSFYASKNARDMKQQSYLDTETLDWSVSSLKDPIQVAYIPSPFYFLRAFLEPFAQVSSLGEWVMTLIGILSTAIVTPAIKNRLSGVVQNRVKSLLERNSKISGRKTTLIISSKGKEKEIEIKEGKSR